MVIDIQQTKIITYFTFRSTGPVSPLILTVPPNIAYT